MYILDITNSITLVLLLAATVLSIFLGKEIKKPLAPAIALVFFLVLVIVHSVQLGYVPEVDYEEIRSVLLMCIATDLTMIFITFFGYLWVDDIACRHFKKKSIDNSLDWFWKKI